MIDLCHFPQTLVQSLLILAGKDPAGEMLATSILFTTHFYLVRVAKRRGVITITYDQYPETVIITNVSIVLFI